MNKKVKPPVFEFWLTGEQWIQFTRAMERCHRIAGAPVGPAACLELLCRSYLARGGDGRAGGYASDRGEGLAAQDGRRARDRDRSHRPLDA